MAKIYSYPIATDAFTDYRVRELHDAAGAAGVTELCTINGVAYISVPDGVVLPTQPPQVVLAEVTLTAELSTAIKLASPHIRLINDLIKEKIRARYGIEDEIKLLRIAPSDETTVYNDYAEECRAWGREQKAGLGL